MSPPSATPPLSAPASSPASSACCLPLSCHLPVLDRSIKFYKLLIRLGVCECVCLCVYPYYITRCVYTLWAHAPLLLLSCFCSSFFVCICIYAFVAYVYVSYFFVLFFVFVVFAYAALFTLLYLLFRYSTTFFHIDHAESRPVPSRLLQLNLPPPLRLRLRL